jgi:hypothetical protein
MPTPRQPLHTQPMKFFSGEDARNREKCSSQALNGKLEEERGAGAELSRTLDQSRREAEAAMEQAEAGTGKEKEELEASLAGLREECGRLQIEVKLGVEAQERLERQVTIHLLNLSSPRPPFPSPFLPCSPS